MTRSKRPEFFGRNSAYVFTLSPFPPDVDVSVSFSFGLQVARFASLQEDGTAMSFRYTVSLKARTHCYYPKALETGNDMMDLRPSMLGVAFADMYHVVPNQDHARIIWEVPLTVKLTFFPYYVLGSFLFWERNKSVPSPLGSEVSLEASVPAVVTPLKPKFWLTSTVSLMAKHAHQIK